MDMFGKIVWVLTFFPRGLLFGVAHFVMLFLTSKKSTAVGIVQSTIVTSRMKIQ